MSFFLNEFQGYFSHFYSDPLSFLSLIQKSLISAQETISKDYDSEEIKNLLIVRLSKIPYCPEIYKSTLNEIDETSIEKMIIVPATVIRVGSRRSLEKQRVFRCVDCSCPYLCFSGIENYNRIELPLRCSNEIKKVKKMNPMAFLFEKIAQKKHKNKPKGQPDEPVPKEKTEACGGRKFESDGSERPVWLDYQEVKVQETFKTLKPGTIPKTMWVILQSSLVDDLKPGDDITIYGILRKRWKRLVPEARPEVSLCIEANSIFVRSQDASNQSSFPRFSQGLRNQAGLTVEEEFEMNWLEISGDLESELRLRNLIIQSVCPSICGKFEIKLAILLTIIGGISRNVNNIRVRGQCHLLLIGEPGTGKSQFLKFAQSLSQRAVFTNGIGSSSAGLTVSCIKEAGDWMLEAGALVLSDQGVCCIDEFNLMKSTDFVAIHEAMEQQTISVAKAGITMKVNARTTIIAGCNPQNPGQKYDETASIVTNSGLTSPLVSRFDLIFILVDEENKELDSKKSDFILGKFTNQRVDVSPEAELWEPDEVREYIKCVQTKVQPFLSEQAQKLLSEYYYNHLRKLEMQGKTTIRALESLLRLSQAHARLMFREKVEVLDAISVIILMENAVWTGIFEGIDISDFVLIDEGKYRYLLGKIEEKFRI